MLVLTRKAGEAILIGRDIRITVAEIRGGQVRLGIEAPLNLPIVREDSHKPKKVRKASG